jgi:two-component system, NarL family, sensor kinase
MTATLAPPGSPHRGVRVLAATLGALTGLAVLAAAVASVRLGWSWADVLDAFVLSNGVMGVAFGACGVILAWHRPRNPIGWLFAVGGLLQAVAASVPPVQSLFERSAATLVTLRLLSTAFVYSWPWAIGLCIPLALLLFPDGRPVSRGWRPVIVAVVLTAPLFVLEMGAAPLPVENGTALQYLTLPFYDRLGWLWQFAEIRTAAVYVVAFAALAVRYRRGNETTRRQLLWLLLALGVVIVALLVWGLVANAPIAVLLAIPLIPVAVTVAIVRYRLLDIRLVVSRAVAWLVLSLAVAVAYAVLVAGLDRLISSQIGQSTVATVLLVLVAAPVLPRLQRIVDRALYGDRANPVRVVSQLGAELAQPVGDQGPEAGLTRVAASIRHALRLPYVAVERDGQVLAADGQTPEPEGSDRMARETLSYGGEVVGDLVVGLRDGEQRLAEPDRRALGLLATPLAVALHATGMSTELQASRQRLIGAREEERRRLRRELHDGLGPALTGIAFTADAAANLVDDPGRTAELLTTLRRDTRAALADVRRVVDDLRPPALDELGLVGALQQRAEQLSWRADGAAVQVRLDVPPEVPALPAAVEVAAYRIATEALTNVARHSQASSAVVRLRYGDRLEVSVSDDGPASGSWSPGVGLQTMRERAAELGGAFSAGPSPAGGQVQAWFPLDGARGTTPLNPRGARNNTRERAQ